MRKITTVFNFFIKFDFLDLGIPRFKILEKQVEFSNFV